MHKTQLYLSSFIFTALFGACASSSDVNCEVVWTDLNGNEVGSTTLIYKDLDDAQAGRAMCEVDQADDPKRPANATGYSCNCST